MVGEQRSGEVTAPSPRVKYAATSDGVRIAYTEAGEGPPLVYLQPNSHVSREWELPETRNWYASVAERHRLIRLDIRRFGLSQREAGPITVETCVADLEAVVQRLALDRFDLMAVAGLTAAAVVYAGRHPERVSRLVLWAAGAREAAWYGTDRERRTNAMHVILDADPALALELQAGFIFGERPGPSEQQLKFVAEAMRPEDLAAWRSCLRDLDVSGMLCLVRAPTLVVYARRSAYLTLEEVQLVASGIRASEFVECDAELYPFREPGVEGNLRVVEAFLGHDVDACGARRELNGKTRLTARELHVLELVSTGRTDAQIAEALTIAPATASRHVHNILEKLGMSRRSEAAVWWAGHGGQPPQGGAP
jgi:pimeloyl-ACP methyl ester carboxylesterase/DNA-binding CsgD family transcriptional regulator